MLIQQILDLSGIFRKRWLRDDETLHLTTQLLHCDGEEHVNSFQLARVVRVLGYFGEERSPTAGLFFHEETPYVKSCNLKTSSSPPQFLFGVKLPN